MTSAASNFTGSIPENYDRGLGPNIFLPYAEDMARRCACFAPERVLEIAAGTGILSERLRATLPETALLNVTDLNSPMLAIARGKLKGALGVEFNEADACDLPFPDADFDLAVCQFGVMFFPDKARHFRETRRVLRRRGRYIFTVWDAFDVNPFAQIAHDTIAGFFATDPPGFYKVPFGYRDIPVILAALNAGGFANASAEIVTLESPIADARLFARGLVLGNPVIEEIRARGASAPEKVIDALASALEREFGSGPSAKMPLQAIAFTAAAGEV